MEILITEDEVEVIVEVEEEEEVGYAKNLQKGIPVEDEETIVFMEMEEDKMCYRELLHIIDRIEIG